MLINFADTVRFFLFFINLKWHAKQSDKIDRSRKTLNIKGRQEETKKEGLFFLISAISRDAELIVKERKILSKKIPNKWINLYI